MLKKFLPPILPTEEFTSSTFSNILTRKYHEQVAQKHIQTDDRQLEVLGHLERLLGNLTAREFYQQKSTAQKLFLSPPEKCRSLYIYGDVGTGKSMLMDLFYTACPFENKRRVHFHAFMQEIHARIYSLRASANKMQKSGRHKPGSSTKEQSDIVQTLAQEISDKLKLLCFDEFHVADIADAMLLGRLFKQLFDAGVVIVCTSNYRPDDLYPGGLQRELFLPFIRLLKETVLNLELNTQQDYRLKHLLSFDRRYFFPLTEYADYLIHQSYTKLTNDASKTPGSIQVLGRTINLTATHGDIALSSFAELCEQPLGAADYLQIANQFSTLILADIPKLSGEQHNETRRFIILIDILYEHKVNLVCSAETAPGEIYTNLDSLVDFKRTVSRLMEMQSEQYLHSRHLSE